MATYPAEHVASGLGDVPEAARPLVATLWGRPRLGHTGVRLADGTRISWRGGRWSVRAPGGGHGERDVEFRTLAM